MKKNSRPLCVFQAVLVRHQERRTVGKEKACYNNNKKRKGDETIRNGKRNEMTSSFRLLFLKTVSHLVVLCSVLFSLDNFLSVSATISSESSVEGIDCLSSTSHLFCQTLRHLSLLRQDSHSTKSCSLPRQRQLQDAHAKQSRVRPRPGAHLQQSQIRQNREAMAEEEACRTHHSSQREAQRAGEPGLFVLPPCGVAVPASHAGVLQLHLPSGRV